MWWGEDIETNEFGFPRVHPALPPDRRRALHLRQRREWLPVRLRSWLEYANFAGDSTLARRRAANGSPEPFNVRYWGVGNENWGCGGNMTPEEYGAEYMRYATYLHDISGTELFLIACGPNGNNADWTRRLLTRLYARPPRAAHARFCRPLLLRHGGTATEYTVDEWYTLIERAMGVETLIRQQRGILDGFDPERKIGLIIDEWGTWHRPTPGYNPRHLWQQNTMRDALVAAASLDVFNRHADKVVMSNIAQTINVLQAMVLADDKRMVTTPTYHVYEMYKHHQGATSVLTRFEGPEITFSPAGEEKSLPALSGSASVRDGVLTLSVVNSSATETLEAAIDFAEASAALTSARVLANADIHAHNTFDAPAAVVPVDRTAPAGVKQLVWAFDPASVTVFRFRLGA